MILREAIRQVRGFRYMIEQLDICSAVGRRALARFEISVGGRI